MITVVEQMVGIATAGNSHYQRAPDGTHLLTVDGIELRLREPKRGQLLVEGFDPEEERVAGSLTGAQVPLAVPAIDLIRHQLARLTLEQQMESLSNRHLQERPLLTLLTLGTRNRSTGSGISIWEIGLPSFDVPASVLRWLATYSELLAAAVATRTDLPTGMISEFVSDPRFTVRAQIARSPQLTPAQLDRLLLDGTPAVRVAALANPTLSAEQLITACQQRSLAAEHPFQIAELKIATPELLAAAWNAPIYPISRDRDRLAAALVRHPNTPVAILEQIAQRGCNSSSKAASWRLQAEASEPHL